MLKEKKLPFKCTTVSEKIKAPPETNSKTTGIQGALRVNSADHRLCFDFHAGPRPRQHRPNRRRPLCKADNPKETPPGSVQTSIKLASRKEGNGKETWNFPVLTLAWGGRWKNLFPDNLSTQINLHTGLKAEFTFFLWSVKPQENN